MPLSIDMPSNENKKGSTEEHINNFLVVSSKVVYSGIKKTI